MLRNLFQKAIRLWYSRTADELPNNDSPVYLFYEKEFPFAIEDFISKIGLKKLKVKGSVGIGGFAHVPFMSIRNTEIADQVSEGPSVTYLFSPHLGKLFLTLIQGTRGLDIDQIRRSTLELRQSIRQPEGFSLGIPEKLAKNERRDTMAFKLRIATAYSKEYEFENLPSDEDLETDLRRSLKSYCDFVSRSI